MARPGCRFVVLSGCSGGGKSALAAELAARGHAVVDEPGRRIVRDEIRKDGTALPWIDMAKFLRRALALSISDIRLAGSRDGLVFFDRGLIDAASALQAVTGEPALDHVATSCPYDRTVFMAPPWPDIYVADAERRHGYEEAVEEYERLTKDYPRLGFDVVDLPRTSIGERADFVLAALARSSPGQWLPAQPSPRNSG